MDKKRKINFFRLLFAIVIPIILMTVYIQIGTMTGFRSVGLDYSVMLIGLITGITFAWKATDTKRLKITLVVVSVPFIILTTMFVGLYVSCLNGNCL